MQSNKRQLNSHQFGNLVIEDKHIFNFPEGILGFENLKEFILISEEDTAPFKWLISLEEPGIGFPLLSPWHVDISYDAGNSFNMENQVIFVVITLADESGAMTANFKAPIVLDVKNQIGKQIILPSDKYSTNFFITKSNKKH